MPSIQLSAVLPHSPPMKTAKKISAKQAKQQALLQQTLKQAMQLHQAGRLPQAVLAYRNILQAYPQQVEALHYLGVAQHQLGHKAEAERLIRAALVLAPDYLDAQNNLGNVLKSMGRTEEAAALYQQVLATRADFAPALCNLGVVLLRQGHRQQAIEKLQAALAIQPNFAEAWHNLGNALIEVEQLDQALSAFEQALKWAPYNEKSYKVLTRALTLRGRRDDALQVFAQWEAFAPKSPVRQHMLAALQAEIAGTVPARASDAYVQQIFDDFADSFDEVLAGLAYRAPQYCADLVASIWPQPAKQLAILDAGCGTGLCGPLLAPWAERLVGVDLSAGMLQKAALREVYTRLDEVELEAYFQSLHAAYDLIVSADTLCYFGVLDTVLAAAHQALRPNGYLVFTVEQAEMGESDSDYVLEPHGRYSHRQRYLQHALQQAGFAELQFQSVQLRMEAGKPVLGWLVSAAKVRVSGG